MSIGWKYSINYGPEGEANWANLTSPEGHLVGNIPTHHAMAIVAAASGEEAYWLRKNAVLVRELGSSMSPGALAAAMERRADALDAAASDDTEEKRS